MTIKHWERSKLISILFSVFKSTKILSRITSVMMVLWRFGARVLSQAPKGSCQSTKWRDYFYNLFLVSKMSTGNFRSATELLLEISYGNLWSHLVRLCRKNLFVPFICSFVMSKLQGNVTCFMCALPDANSLCLTLWMTVTFCSLSVPQ
jgi:hypothetical protein